MKLTNKDIEYFTDDENIKKYKPTKKIVKIQKKKLRNNDDD